MYETGASNEVADAQSHKLEEEVRDKVDLSMISKPYWPNFNKMEEEIQKDGTLQKITEDLKSNPDSHGNYTLENDKLHYMERLVLSSTSSWIPQMI